MVKVIAEAGVNHNGSLDLALELTEVAAKAGACAVKFQTFKAEQVATKAAEKASYQKQSTGNSGSQLDMLRSLELKKEWHKELSELAVKLGMEFMSTPFDEDSLRFLVDEVGVKTLKIPSGEITNAPLLLEFARSDCELILSTGMSSMAEVEEAVSLLGWAMAFPERQPSSRKEFQEAWRTPEIFDLLKSRLTVLHCTSQYPAPPEFVDLKAMQAMKERLQLPVGYSDHTQGQNIAVAAVATGASVIEKHFTLDCSMDGPDHQASLEPEPLAQMITAVREVDLAMGDGVKAMQACEKDTALVARRSLVARRALKAGDVIGCADLGVMRPGTGINPMNYWDVAGSSVKEDILENDLITSGAI